MCGQALGSWAKRAKDVASFFFFLNSVRDKSFYELRLLPLSDWNAFDFFVYYPLLSVMTTFPTS